MFFEDILKILEVVSEIIIAMTACVALNSWKKKINEEDKYRMAKDLLKKIKGIEFIVKKPNLTEFHFIYLNDILVDKNKFYNDQLSLISDKRVFIDINSANNLLDYININTRSDFFVPKKIRECLNDLYLSFCTETFKKEEVDRYITIKIPKNKYQNNNNKVNDEIKDLCCFLNNKELTIKEYFLKWEKLLNELQKEIYK
jgi:hypothetical protein